MNRYTILTLAALIATAGIAAAQTTPPGSGGTTTPARPPVTGTLPDTSGKAISATTAKTQIESNGYSGVKNLVRKEDGSWQAKAMKGSVEVAVSVDATGKVTQMSQ